MLLLKKHLVELVRQGRKRQTIRFWSRPIVFAGQISYTPGLGKMKILSVEVVDGYAGLTEADAIADGFANRAELLAELERTYGPPPEGKTLYRVRFDWPVDDGDDATKKTTKPTAAATGPAARAPRKALADAAVPAGQTLATADRVAADSPPKDHAIPAATQDAKSMSFPPPAFVGAPAMAPVQRKKLLGHVLANNPFATSSDNDQ